MPWPSKFCFLLLLVVVRAQASPEPRSSCADHFLHGQYRTRVLPITDGTTTYNVECVMPRSADNFQLGVETVIRNSLEKPYHLFGEKRTISYQISNWDFLESKVRSAYRCEQDIKIDWRPLGTDGRNQSFAVVSLTGKTQTFYANHSLTPTVEAKFTTDGAVGVLHLIPLSETPNFTATVTLSSLRCQHRVIRDESCEFELVNPNKGDLRVLTGGARALSFAFRTEKPNGRFLILETNSGDQEMIELEEGYLLTMNNLHYPIRLLADGNWHTVTIDLKEKILYVDERQEHAYVSLDIPSLASGIKAVRILLNGTVGAIKLGTNSGWECRGSASLNAPPSELVLSKICPILDPSYCHCKAPASAILANHNRSKFHDVKCDALPNVAEGFTLGRNPSKLAFFYFHNRLPKRSLSMAFRSDAGSGLLFFGQNHVDPIKRGNLERYQVYYEGDRVIAGSCLYEGDQASCKSCEIRRAGGFANEWVRVSLFNSSSYTYLTVDDQICKLSPGKGVLNAHDFYKAPVSPFLFVGGAFYGKTNALVQRVKRSFTEMFYDKTNQKAPSLRGCISQLRVDGAAINLHQQFNSQRKDILENSNSESAFAMKRGCSECALDCEDAPCRSQSTKQICDCSKNYGSPTEDGKCTKRDGFALWLNSTDAVALELPVLPHRKRVTKVWALLRLPELNKEPVAFISWSGVQLLASDYGRKLTIDFEDFAQETFNIQSDDERLHLVSIEEDPATPVTGEQSYRLRVDSETRSLSLSSRFSLQTAFQVNIHSLKYDRSSEAFGGCLDGLYFALDYGREFDSDLEFVNVVNSLMTSGHASRNVSKLQMRIGETCGVRDPTLWTELPSTSLGQVTEYDPQGVQQSQKEYGIPWLLIFLLVIILMVITCLCVLIVYRRVGKRTYVLEKKGVKDNGDLDETHPLYEGDAASNNSPQTVKTLTESDYRQNQSDFSREDQQPYRTTIVNMQQQETPRTTAKLASKEEL